MPQIALDQNGNRVRPQEAQTEKAWAYECLQCSCDMTVVGGEETRYRRHFRHRPDESCLLGYGDETIEHKEVKADVAQLLAECDWARGVDTEIWVDQHNKPDVLFEKESEKIGIEIQVSPISAEDLRERTRRRSSSGIHTLWLFYENSYTSSKSKNGNVYIAYRQGEYGYISLFKDQAKPIINYCDSGGQTIGTAKTISEFDDGDGGFVETERPIRQLETFMTKRGFRLAAEPRTVPDDVGDEQQARLF